jgi:hypothetical protein
MRPPRPDEMQVMSLEWSGMIEVERRGDRLTIRGKSASTAPPRDLHQLFRDYLFADVTEREAQGPHLEFASAESDDELLTFIKKWGPITAPSVIDDDGSKTAEESLTKIRGIRLEVESAVSLLRIIRTDKPDPDAVLTAMSRFGVSKEPMQSDAPGTIGGTADCELIYNEACDLRRRDELNGPNLTEKCLEMLCALVQRFPDTWIATKEGVISAPAPGHGVLPLLIFMLRQDLFSNRKIITCERCGRYLLQRRQAECACDSCKEPLRSKRYYEKKKEEVLLRRKMKRRLLREAKSA